MKVYIAGAITNNPRYKEQFETAEKRLISMNHAVINPVKNLGFEYREYLDMGLCELMKCDAIYLLAGYEKSKGAQLEFLYAQTVGMRIIEENPCLYRGSENEGGVVMARNRYPGYCYCCGKYTPAGYGHFERHNGGWRIKCVKCASGRTVKDTDKEVIRVKRLRDKEV